MHDRCTFDANRCTKDAPLMHTDAPRYTNDGDLQSYRIGFVDVGSFIASIQTRAAGDLGIG
jgi:hypothetical protein